MFLALSKSIWCGDPVVLLHDIRQSQARLAALADTASFNVDDAAKEADIGDFLSGLRHAWKEGEVRPTSRKKPPVPRGRRRPDPLAEVTDELKAWFLEDQSQAGRDLLNRLQAAYPDTYPDGLLRTIQRRLKVWRGDMARELVFGAGQCAKPLMASDALRNLETPRARGHQALLLGAHSGLFGQPFQRNADRHSGVRGQSSRGMLSV